MRRWWATALYVPLGIAAAAAGVAGRQRTLDVVVPVLLYLAFVMTGDWIVARTGNRVGWLFRSLAILAAVLATAQGLVDDAIAQEGFSPAATWAALISQVVFGPFFACSFVLPFMLFPTGRAHSARWRIVEWATYGWVVITAAAAATYPVLEVSATRRLDNPLGIGWLRPVTALFVGNVFELMAAFGMVAVVSLVFRYRAAGSEQRAQIRWFLLAGIFLIVALISDEVLLDALGVENAPLETALEIGGMFLGLLGLPAATLVAIFRYRLYEVDVIINKALVYGSLTAILVALYLGIVVVLRNLTSGFTGDSDIAVAASTLVVAAAFRPLRDAVQSFIDRRFYRSRYDARVELGAFTAAMRNEVQLPQIEERVLHVVQETVKPRHASVWVSAAGSVR